MTALRISLPRSSGQAVLVLMLAAVLMGCGLARGGHATAKPAEASSPGGETAGSPVAGFHLAAAEAGDPVTDPTIHPGFDTPHHAGLGGPVIWRAYRVYAGLTGHYPSQLEDMAELWPFGDPLFDGFVLRPIWRERSAADGEWWMGVERPLQDDPISRHYSGKTYGPEYWRETQPPVGIHEGMERYPLAMTSSETQAGLTFVDSETLTYYRQGLADPFPACIEDPQPYAIEGGLLWQQPPMHPLTKLRLGHLIMSVAEASEVYRAFSPDGLPATSLEQLAARWGGLNLQAWINPYTHAPMRHVPLTEASAGDYTELSSPEGVRIAFHYVDCHGRVSTFIAGVQGSFAECCDLDAWLADGAWEGSGGPPHDFPE